MRDQFSRFMDNLLQFGLEYFGRFYGLYRGQVISNKDPDNQGRIKVTVPCIGDHEIGDWAYPVMIHAGKDPDDASKKYGEFWPPEEGDGVWVAFENGEPSIPLYLGGWYAREELYDDFVAEADQSPTARGWRTKGGHKIVLDDKAGEQTLTVSWTNGTDETKLFVNNDSTVLIDVKGKHSVHLKEDELEVRLSEGAAAKVVGKDSGATTTLGDGSVAAAIADHLQTFYNQIKAKLDAFDAHIHPTGVGPSGTPQPTIVAPPWDTKINSNKLKFPDG